MLPIFDEYKYATDMNNGCSKDRDREEKRVYTFRDLLIYTKWLRWSLWNSEEDSLEKDNKVYNGLITFCQQLQMHFNIDTDYNKINNVIAQSKEYKLRTCYPSYITYKEWSQIMMLPDDKSRRAYFALLILAKFNRNNPVINIKNTERVYEDKRFKINLSVADIYKYAGVKFNRNEIKENKILYYQPLLTLQEAGLIEKKLSKNKCTIILTDADIEINSQDIFIAITKYEDIDSYYKYGLHEDRYKICQSCGKAFKGNNQNNDKYCKDCVAKDDYHFHYIHCKDCGMRVKVSNYNTKTKRCKSCQDIYNKQYDKNRKNG